MKCTNCQGNDLKWYIGVAGPRDVTDGRLRLSEVSPVVYLACEDCSETLKVVRDEDEINDMLNSRRRK